MTSRKAWMWCQSVEPITSRNSMGGCIEVTGCALAIVTALPSFTAITLLSLEYLPECSECRGNRLLSLGFQIGTERRKVLYRHIGIKVVFYMIIVTVYDITIHGIRAISPGIHEYITF